MIAELNPVSAHTINTWYMPYLAGGLSLKVQLPSDTYWNAGKDKDLVEDNVRDKDSRIF